jgi:exo-beta-1,3-glucanase (GH17 family)
MEHGRFIAYEPATRQIVNGIPTRADPDVIRGDLKVLRARFDSLITYTAVNGEEAIPAIAASLGYRALIIGVYDPFNASELDAAVAAVRANPELVVGLSLGNELVFFHRHSAAEMEKLFDTVRGEIPQAALASTEPFHMFYPAEAAPLLKRMDFLLPNVHPIFEPWFRTASSEDAAQFVVNVASKLAESYCGPILVKETGIPTAPQNKGYTEMRQASFYQALQQRFPASGERAFTYFEAFDTPWRLNDYGPQGQRPALEEAHWGLYDEKRQPKAVVALIAPLAPRH